MSQVLVLDNKDDRTELFALLHRLPPVARIRFLQDCCKSVPPTNQNRLPVPAIWKMRTTLDRAYRSEAENERLTREVLCDVVQLFNTWNLDAAATAVRLESLVRSLRL